MSPADKIKKTLQKLNKKLEREKKPANIEFKDFLELLSKTPAKSLRNIFQLFHDMIRYYVPHGINEYPNDPESINYIQYDTGALFVEGAENPFFADRLLANRLINVADSLKEGVVKNKMLVFVGPPGSGKSTFLNNILQKLEDYSELDEGVMYETVWQIDTEMFGFPHILRSKSIKPELIFNREEEIEKEESILNKFTDRYLIVPCPSHDHPIIQIPKQYRRELLDELIEDRDFKKKLFHHREYEWVFKNTPCPICSSLYKTLSEKFSPEQILGMLHVRKYEFSRKLGEGISVYNPGDKLKQVPLGNSELQKWINSILKTSDAISYTYSRMAKTNNGVYAVMDVKVNNIDRLKNLHGIISDGIHKVETFEETINSLFLALVNPADIAIIDQEKSFKDRVLKIPIPYVRDYKTEREIYKNTFGGGIDEHFLPRILMAFAKTVVSTRLKNDSSEMNEWIKNPEKYAKFCDKSLLLLKMEIYSGYIPKWLSEEDMKKLDRNMRQRIIIQEGNAEGNTGFSGRESLEMFNSFYNRHKNRDYLINMENLLEFFKPFEYHDKLPKDFLPSLEQFYDYTVLQEVEESMFYYNKDQISKDISNYLFSVNLDIGSTWECPYTGNSLDITENYYLNMEKRLIKGNATEKECQEFRNDVLKQYVSKTLHEINSNKNIEKTDQFNSLLKRYYQNLKENVLTPFISNENFRRAIQDFGSDSFKNYDERIKDEVKLLIKNLRFKFQYSEKAAKQICIYLIDKKLVEKFAE